MDDSIAGLKFAVERAQARLPVSVDTTRVAERIATWYFDGPAPTLEGIDEGVRRFLAIVVVEYVADALSDHELSESEQAKVRILRHVFGLDDGELLRLAGREIASLLDQELDLMLRDFQFDSMEALRQVELQRAFALGYDDYVHLIAPTFERLAKMLKAEGDAAGTPEAARAATAKRLEQLKQLAGG